MPRVLIAARLRSGSGGLNPTRPRFNTPKGMVIMTQEAVNILPLVVKMETIEGLE